jgi:hypothetical protein
MQKLTIFFLPVVWEDGREIFSLVASQRMGIFWGCDGIATDGTANGRMRREMVWNFIFYLICYNHIYFFSDMMGREARFVGFIRMN